MNFKDVLGDRMKSFYEDPYRIYLPMRIPVIVRCDGKSFHTFTRDCKRPIDDLFVDAMNKVTITLCQEIQGAKVGFVQSDEISILINNYTELNTQGWLKNNLQKMTSIAAGIASSVMTEESVKIFGSSKRAVFDARVFVLPKEEVNNYFYWRQKDCEKNSLQSLARTLYSHKELFGKVNNQLQELCFQKGINWNDCPTSQKRGRCIVKTRSLKNSINKKTGFEVSALRSEWIVDQEIPIFSQDRNYIEKYLT